MIMFHIKLIVSQWMIEKKHLLSDNHISNSTVLALVVVKLLILPNSQDYLVKRWLLLMPQVVHQFMVSASHTAHMLLINKVVVQLGQTHYLKIMLNLVLVWFVLLLKDVIRSKKLLRKLMVKNNVQKSWRKLLLNG